MIGFVDSVADGYKIRKHSLALSLGFNKAPKAFDIDKWLSCVLLDAMESQGVRKFVAYEPDSNTKHALRLWIFAPSLSISSSHQSSAKYAQVAKVLWKHTDTAIEKEEKLDSSTLGEGEIRLNPGELELLQTRLERSSSILPQDAKTFQEWHVGLLERFTSSDLESP